MTLLEQAAALIEQHIETLNTESSTCPCCEAVRFEKWYDQLAYKELSAMSRKLRTRFKGEDPE